jgi:hypothetical protein
MQTKEPENMHIMNLSVNSICAHSENVHVMNLSVFLNVILSDHSYLNQPYPTHVLTYKGTDQGLGGNQIWFSVV